MKYDNLRVACLICTVVLASAGPALAVSGHSAGLPLGAYTYRADPDVAPTAPFDRYTVVTQPQWAAVAGDYVPLDFLATPFDNRTGGQAGTGHYGQILSGVAWHTPTGRLLFGYQIELLPGSSSVANGVIDGWGGFNVADSGVVETDQSVGGQRPFALSRQTDAPGAIRFDFQSFATLSLAPGAEGAHSAMFYLETDRPALYTTGFASMIGPARTADGLLVLVPTDFEEPPHVPEPLTMAAIGAGVGVAAGVARKRTGSARKRRS